LVQIEIEGSDNPAVTKFNHLNWQPLRVDSFLSIQFPWYYVMFEVKHWVWRPVLVC